MNIALAAILLLQTETVQTEHFEVVSTVLNKSYVKAVADSLEAAYPAMIATLGEKVEEKTRYRINLYATIKEYEAIDAMLNGGRLKANLAFSHVDTGESYLVAQPRDAMLPVPDKFRALVRHEAYHLVTFRHGVREGRSAPWMEEGMADIASEQAERVGGGEPLAGSIKFANAVHRVRAFQKEAKLIPLGKLLEEDSSKQGPGMASLWYEQSWLFVKYLKEKRNQQWTEFLKEFRQAGEPGGEDERIIHVKTILLGSLGDPVANVEKDWHAWIEGLKPAPWWRISDGGDWRLTKDGVEAGAWKDRATYLISANTFKGERYRVRAEVQVMDGGLGQVDLVLTPSVEDRDAGNLIKGVVTRAGDANILARRKGEWVNLSHRKVDGSRFAADKWVPVELEVDARTVRLKVAGEVAVEHTFTDKVDELHHIRWGLGNYDSWTKFRAIEIKKN